MSSQKPPSKSAENAKRFISVEYSGRKVAIRRSSSYYTTIELIKKAFLPLNSVSPQRISICAFVEELDDTLEISEDIWNELLPDLKRVTVHLDSTFRDSEQAELEESKPQSPKPAVKRSAKTSSSKVVDKHPVYKTIPQQQKYYETRHFEHILYLKYTDDAGTSAVRCCFTEPDTTIEDLKGYAVSISPVKGSRFDFRYQYGTLNCYSRVGQLGPGPGQFRVIEISVS
ncbi:ubiquitin family protein [Ceratobasidium sp. AG-Ba]|nr:ubiquitin family protein [Ceratobasidium sp. AG-Ba]